MREKPSNWIKHYKGNENEIAFKFKYSFSDRCRYYLPEPEMDRAVKKLISNLRTADIPLSLLSQYMPIQYAKIRRGVLSPDPEALIRDRISNCIDDYLYACGS
jgi:D-tagatose-1,6-bisphosphate aldolase subunit GatZ/KbaZ